MQVRNVLTAPWFGPVLVAGAVWCAVVAGVDPAGSYPRMPEGPGLTVDEMFNVEQGAFLVEAARQYGLGLLDPQSIREVFDSPMYNPDHPPAGRLWLGLHHHLTRAVAPPLDPVNVHQPVTACARTGSAAAFALTILLVGWFAGTKFDPLTGFFAALMLPLMPRLWGHAHLASLETVTNLVCTAAVLSAANAWSKSTPPTLRSGLVPGVMIGLAFLTKIQAILLPIPLAIWCLWRWRVQAIKPLAMWGVTAAVVFFVGWPWLWLDPAGHAKAYFARTTARATLSVWYFGAHYADVAVPWHYPWVMCLTTIPVATLLLGLYGLCGRRTSDTDAQTSLRWLLAGNVMFPLVVFSLPNVAVYDGERLFLTVFPLWAILSARGAAMLWEKISARWIGTTLLAVIFAFQLGNLIRFSPCPLSFYNLLVGGTAGAERLGLETTYWGDGVTRTLLQELDRKIPKGSTVHLAPVLHQFQVDGPNHRADLVGQSPILRRHDVRLAPWAGSPRDGDYLLIYRRRADLPADLRFGPSGAELLAETRRGDVQLAALYRLRIAPLH